MPEVPRSLGTYNGPPGMSNLQVRRSNASLHTPQRGGGGGGASPPPVSQILQKADMYGYPKTATSHEKMQHGTHVHKLTEMNDDEIIWADDLDGRERGCIEAYERFKKEFEHEIIHTEKIIYHPLYLYAGKLDRIISRKVGRGTDRLVLEIKTGQPHPAAALQLSAYVEAYNSMQETDPKVSESAALYLKDDGNYKLIINKDHESSFSLFLSCLQIVRWKDKHRIGKR